MYYYIHMFRRLRKILPSVLLLKIYKAHVQSKIDYGLSIWAVITEVNLNCVLQIQNLLARIICNNFHCIHLRGIDLIRSLKLQTIRESRDHFLCVLCSNLFMASHPIIWVLICMGMIQGALRIWICIYHGAPRRFIKEVFLIRVVHYGINCPRG